MNHHMRNLYSHFRSFSFLLLCSATAAQCMEPQENKPITFAQIYHRLAEFLHPDVIPLIFSFHLDSSGIDYTNLPTLIKESSKSAEKCAKTMHTFLKPGNYTLVAEIFERAFAHEKISICDIKNARNGWNVLHEAVHKQHLKIVKITLNIAGDKTWTLLTAKTNFGQIPLHCASNGKDTEIIKLLMKAAGDKTWMLLTIKDDAGWTALHYAAQNGSTEMVKLLLNAAGDNAWTLLTTKSQNGYTALHYAANNNSTEIVELLLNTAGNNAQEFMDIRNRYEATAFDFAKQQAKEVMKKYRKNNQ